MAKFKVGDRVRILGNCGPDRVGLVGTVIKYNGSPTLPYRVRHAKASGELFNEVDLELVTTNKETKPVGRRTFRQIKESVDSKRGATWQEACEDGTQEYTCITPELVKGTDKNILYRDRSMLEEQPEWFVEVFKVEPEYMTREELDRYHAFLGKKKLGRPVGSVNVSLKLTKGKPGVFVRTPAMRAAQSRKMKAFYARKRRNAR